MPDAEHTDADTEALFRSHAPFVARFLFRLGVAAEELDDVVQEVFLVVHRNGGYVAGQATRVTYLANIAVRAAASWRRRDRTKRARWAELGCPYMPVLRPGTGRRAGRARSDAALAESSRRLDPTELGPDPRRARRRELRVHRGGHEHSEWHGRSRVQSGPEALHEGRRGRRGGLVAGAGVREGEERRTRSMAIRSMFSWRSRSADELLDSRPHEASGAVRRSTSLVRHQALFWAGASLPPWADGMFHPAKGAGGAATGVCGRWLAPVADGGCVLGVSVSEAAFRPSSPRASSTTLPAARASLAGDDVVASPEPVGAVPQTERLLLRLRGTSPGSLANPRQRDHAARPELGSPPARRTGNRTQAGPGLTATRVHERRRRLRRRDRRPFVPPRRERPGRGRAGPRCRAGPCRDDGAAGDRPSPVSSVASTAPTAAPVHGAAQDPDDPARDAGRRRGGGLVGSDPGRALAIVRACEARFPNGLHAGRNAATSRSMSLFGLGRRAEARAAADRFLHDHPDGTFSPRIRSAMAKDSSSGRDNDAVFEPARERRGRGAPPRRRSRARPSPSESRSRRRSPPERPSSAGADAGHAHHRAAEIALGAGQHAVLPGAASGGIVGLHRAPVVNHVDAPCLATSAA